MLRRVLFRGGATRALGRCQCSSSSKGDKPATTASMFGPLSNQVDQRILENYSPGNMLFETLTSKEGWDSVMDLQDRRIINVLRDPINSVSVFADLKNPLLVKYKFDAADFLVGSKEAFRQINMGIASLELFNFANGFVKSCATNDLLKQAVSPDIYTAVLTAAKGDSSISLAHKKATGVQQTIMTSCTVTDVELRSVNVEVVDESTFSAEAMMQDFIDKNWDKKAPTADAAAAVEATSESSPAESGANPTLQPPTPDSSRPKIKRPATEMHLLTYPLGSVCAIVDVLFTAKEVYATKMASGEDMTHERESAQVWTFVAEISGKTEMDWVATTFRFAQRGAFE